MTHSEGEKRRLTSIDNRLNVYFHNRATRASRQCEKALRCRDWWGKILFRKCFVWYRKEDRCVGRNVGISGIMEMGRMCVMVIRKKRLEFFITLYQGFLGFWSVVSCNIQWNGTAFRDKNNKVEQDNLCIVGVHKSLWKLITKIYIFFWYTYSWIFVKFWIFFFNSMFKIKVPDDFYVIIFAIFRQQYCLYYIKCN